jgi:signal transduction histidine kinase
MKQIFFLGLLFLSALRVASQAENVDSLLNALNTKALTIDEQFILYEIICQHYFAAYDSENTMEYAEKGLALSEKEKNDLKSSIFNEFIGYAYQDKRSFDTAHIYFEKTLKHALKAGDIEQQVSAYMDIGTCYGNLEIWDLALEQYLKALPLSENLENKEKYMSLLGNIGSMHRTLDNLDKAFFYFEQMKETAEKTNSLHHKRKAYYELGVIYKDKMEYDKSLEYLQTALDISRSTGSKRYETMCLQVLAQLYSKEGLILSEDVNDPIYSSISWTTLSIVYCRQKNYRESINAACKAIACDSVNMRNMLTLYSNLTDSYISIGNIDSAIIVFHQYCDLKDKYITKELQESITNMEVKYETAKKETRIAVLEKERKLYVWLGIAGSLLAITLIIVLWQSKRNARKERQLIAAHAIQDGEMGERARIAEDLHDRLGGSLSAVKIELKNAENLQNVSDKLDECIKEIREITHNLMPRSLQLFGMKGALEDFTAQFPQVHFHFFGEAKRIKERLEFVVYCCASELVTNSLRYSGAENINVQLIQDENHVSLTVQDDGCGFDEQTVTRGIGLKNTRDRVASCNGKIDIITSPGKGTETVIELRIKN